MLMGGCRGQNFTLNSWGCSDNLTRDVMRFEVRGSPWNANALHAFFGLGSIEGQV